MVTVRVEHGDVFERRTDALVLKYAQGLYGVDAAAFGRTGAVAAEDLPDIGRSLVVRRPDGIGASSLVFLGVAALPSFGYTEIRRFGHQAVVVASEVNARDICLTMHGTGYGLDEAEAFRAEVAGVFDAIDGDDAGPAFVEVTLVDIDERRVARLRTLLDDMVRRRDRPARDPESAGISSDRKRHAFVAMSTANPNVYLEIGYAWAAGRPTVLLCGEDSVPRFDVRGHRYLRYGSIRDLEKKLRAELSGLGW